MADTFLSTPRRGRPWTVAVLATALASGLLGCSSSTPKPTAHPLTAAEADLLAGALYNDYQAKGATFDIAVQVAPGKTINMHGEVDWATKHGHATVAARGTEDGVAEVYWSSDLVLERRPALVSILAQAGRPGITWVDRPVDKTRYLDEVIGEIVGFASVQRDNPLLIRQASGSEFVRTDTLRGTKVDVLRYGTLTTYWIDPTSGRVLRIEANNTPGTRPLLFDVLSDGPQTISGPAANTVIDVAEISDLYAGVTAATEP